MFNLLRKSMQRVSPVAFVLLAACAVPKMPIESETVPARFMGGFTQERVAGSMVMTVRTFVVAEGSRQEVAGAACKMESEELSAEFVSPANILVPTFVQRRQLAERGRPSSLRVACTTDVAQGVTTIVGVDKEVSTATNAGIAGAILTTVVSAAMANSTPWRYGSAVDVTLLPKQ